MDKMHKRMILSSIRDVIHILDSAPIKPDLIPQITATQMMNRAPIAHLSIERGLKSLIIESGGQPREEHNLLPLLQKLANLNPDAARFLSESFEDAVRVYRYKVNVTGLEHLKSLDSYLSKVGSTKAFNTMRYWEFGQSLDEDLLNRICLPMHREILCALWQLFMASDSRLDTVTDRIERAVKDAIFNPSKLAYTPGSEKETIVKWYMDWLYKEHSTFREALADAVSKNFNVKDDFINQILLNAYEALLKSDDPAVRYFVYTLNVLPPQPRYPGKETTVEWLGPSKEHRMGLVSSPAGTSLGDIERGADGLWYVTPLRDGPIRVSAIAISQTDARCYLADLLTYLVSAAINGGEPRQLRLVGEGDLPFLLSGSRMVNEGRRDALMAFDLDFWDENHGMQVGHKILIESRSTEWQAIDILEGEVVAVDRQLVSALGTQSVRAVNRTKTDLA